MRILTESKLAAVLGAVPGPPRVVAGGNFATLWRALGVLDAAVAEYWLFMLNAQAGVSVSAPFPTRCRPRSGTGGASR
jgi:hypothetical protein